MIMHRNGPGQPPRGFGPYPFPILAPKALFPPPAAVSTLRPEVLGDSTATMSRLLVERPSRRMDVLARKLNCFGYFDGDDDRPRAA
jgi:hypothetical protein